MQTDRIQSKLLISLTQNPIWRKISLVC